MRKRNRHLWVSIFSVFLSFMVAVSAGVVLAWDAPTENEDDTELVDLAGYKLYWGTSSNDFTFSLDAGSNNWAVVSNLTAGVEYHFAVTAYNLHDNESAYSSQIVWIAASTTNNVAVIWKRPLLDIEGNLLPTNSVVSYQVMVATNSNMDGAVRVADVPATSYDVEAVCIKLDTKVSYISVIPVDVLGQLGPMVPPVVYNLIIAPGPVRELKVLTE